MKILVTGAAGFIGMHVCQRLLVRGEEVIGIDNLNSYYSLLYKKKRLNILKKYNKFKFYKIDISNFEKLEHIFKKNKFDFVVNLAAQAGVRYSISNPKEYMCSNILGFFNIAELSRLYNIKKVYYASSSSVYGESSKFPIKETITTYPKNIMKRLQKYIQVIIIFSF